MSESARILSNFRYEKTGFWVICVEFAVKVTVFSSLLSFTSVETPYQPISVFFPNFYFEPASATGIRLHFLRRSSQIFGLGQPLTSILFSSSSSSLRLLFDPFGLLAPLGRNVWNVLSADKIMNFGVCFKQFLLDLKLGMIFTERDVGFCIRLKSEREDYLLWQSQSHSLNCRASVSVVVMLRIFLFFFKSLGVFGTFAYLHLPPASFPFNVQASFHCPQNR